MWNVSVCEKKIWILSIARLSCVMPKARTLYALYMSGELQNVEAAVQTVLLKSLLPPCHFTIAQAVSHRTVRISIAKYSKSP